MIKTLYDYANLLKDDPSLKSYFSPAENPFEGREEKGKVLIGIIEKGKFKGFELENFKSLEIDNYLYRRPAGARGTNTVPTLMVNKAAPEKTSGKIIKSIDNYNHLFIDNREIDAITTALEAYSFHKDYSYLVTFKLDGKYFGEFEKYKNVFNNEAYNKYFKKSYGNSKKEEQLCALTGEISTVYGFVDVLGFTVDAESFRRNGFNASHAYKMFPVSEKAIPVLEGSKSILLNKLAASFYGQLKYALVPHFIFLKDKEIGIEVSENFLTKAALNVDSKEDAGSYAFVNDSESLLQKIIEDDDLKRSDIYYALLFFEQQQAQFKVYLEINDIVPSRINHVLNAKIEAEERYKHFNSYQTKEGRIISQRITLYRLREYFRTGENDLQPSYFKLVNSIFTGQPYNDSKLVSLVLNTWKKSFKKHFNQEENTFSKTVKHSLGNLYFLHLIGIFKKQDIMKEQTNLAEKQDAFSFIENHPAYFTKEYLKGAFIFGCLVTRLFYNQPGKAFMKELNGLSIDKGIVIKKFPKLIAKLRQYDKEFSDLESAAQRYFAINDNATKDEISFSFAMGLVLQKDFDRLNKKDNQ